MRGIFTRDERLVVAFLVAALTVGALVVGSGRVEPPRAHGPSGSAPETLAVAMESAAPVDINTADGPLLETLPGIGPAKALAILELREERGSFSSVDELDDVRGIGPATLERLRPLVVAGDPALQRDGGFQDD